MRYIWFAVIGNVTGSMFRPIHGVPGDLGSGGTNQPNPGSLSGVERSLDERSFRVPVVRGSPQNEPLTSGVILDKLGGRSVSSSPSTDIESPLGQSSPVSMSPVPFLTGEQNPWTLAGDMLTAVKRLMSAGIGARAGLIVSASEDDSGASGSVVAARFDELHQLFTEAGWDDEDLSFSLSHTASALRASEDVDLDALIHTFMNHNSATPLSTRITRGIQACGAVRIETPASCVPSKLFIRGLGDPIEFDPMRRLVLESGRFLTYSSSDHPFTVRVPQRLNVSWARAVCRERAVLKELSSEGIAVSRPLPIGELVGQNPACKELMIVQRNAPMTAGKFLSLSVPDQLVITERMLSLITELNRFISLGASLEVTHFSQGGVKLIACPSCRALNDSWTVEQLLDDDSDEEEMESPQAVIGQDRQCALDMVGTLWSGRESPLDGVSKDNWDMERISQKIAEAKSRYTSGRCVLTPDQQRLVAYEVEETEFALCMHEAGIQSSVSTCWGAGDSPHIFLMDGRELTFRSEPLGTGASAVSYLSQDEAAVAKVLKVRPATGQELCREKAIMRALENTCASGVVKALRVDWTRSGMDKACQAQILIMENGGSHSMEDNNGFTQSEWDAALVKIVSILQTIHIAGYLHADMNMGNVVFRDRHDVPGTLKVIDLGKAVRLYDSHGVQPSRFTHQIMKMQTRLRDIYMAYFFASLKIKAERNEGLSERAKSAIKYIESVALNPHTKDSEPLYAEII